MEYRPEIDGLRAIAVLSVVFFHAGFELFSGGFVGVDVFFVISGYLITSLILKDIYTGSFALKVFYLRRARRIFPALFLVTLVCIPFVWFTYDIREIESFGQTVFGVLTFSANFVLWKQAGYFEVSNELKPLLHTWSLAVEEQYYLIFPLACMFLCRWGAKAIVCAVVAVFCVSFMVGDWGSFHRPGAAFYLLPTRAWEILAGVLGAIYLQAGSKHRLSFWWREFLAVLGLVMVLYAVFVFDAATAVPGRYLLVPVIGTVLIILFADRRNTICKVLAWKPFVTIGLTSYSLYLWHQPVFAFARHQGLIETASWRAVFLILFLAPISYFSWRFVEMPFRTNPQYTRLIRLSTLGPLVLICSVAGWFGFELYVGSRYGFSHLDVAQQFSDPGGYVVSRWPKFVLRDFNEADPRVKVVLIGDSFAQDVLNAVFESKLLDRYQLSTYHISARCGNLWTDRDLTEFISKVDRAECAKYSKYQEPKLQKLMMQADEVWLASSWRSWQVPFVEETIDRIERRFIARGRVFGTKHIWSGGGFAAYSEALSQGNDELVVEVDPQLLKINRELLNIVGENRFVDLQSLICGPDATCQNTTHSGLLISYDGGHLTFDGAKLLGHRLEDMLVLQK